jgi:Zn-dependent M28 family amino/carboxypeptidase
MNGRVDKIPQLVVAREDGERMARLLASGKPLEAEISIPNRLGGPLTTANVVAELRGSELPNEWVVLGAHLDSWELGTGALDNGCNAALVVDALRAIKASGLRPRRSIRFVLFSGEEEGMLGSRAYVEAHRAEMDNAIAMIVFDEGTGAVTGFSVNGRKDIIPAVKELIKPLEPWKATELTDDVVVGTDNLDFMFEGVPNLVANQEAANYLMNYHASSDTFDKVDFAALKKHVAMAAEVSFAIADAPSRLAGRQSRVQIEQMLEQTKSDQQLKAFGLWDEWNQGKRGRGK